jgi:nicotinamidase-related amidase
MDYAKTALILVGYQNDYFAQNGILRGVVEEPGRVDKVLYQTLALVNKLVPTQALIVSTPIVLTPDYRALASPSGILHTIKESGAFAQGSIGAETIPEIKAFGDRIVYVGGKVGFNGFSNTALDTVLKANQIEKVLLAGMVTSLCIDSTGRAAYERGYSVTVLSDCTSARTPTEQDFFCNSVFPLYAAVTTGALA